VNLKERPEVVVVLGDLLRRRHHRRECTTYFYDPGSAFHELVKGLIRIFVN